MTRTPSEAAPAAGEIEAPWQVWVDTGGTFTDCLALDPAGELHRVKVLSSSALRARTERLEDDGRTLLYAAPWTLPTGFADGARVLGLGLETRVIASGPGRLELERALVGAVTGGASFTLSFAEEAPVLAARWVTGTPAGRPLPPLALRLATTRGTNALLERRGARVAFFVTRGFADLLLIGDQQRPDLFALDAHRPPPLYEEAVEVDERLAADGSVLRPLDLRALVPEARRLREAGVRSAAVALLHSYRNPAHEAAVAAFLAEHGFEHVAASAELAPLIKILPRAATAVADAYLMPIIEAYLAEVSRSVGEQTESTVHVMTSAGGLVRSQRYRAKDSLLSGPAGGVVGAAAAGRECGFERLVAFDMGGTSTDVSRYDGDFEYLFEHRVGDANLASPALAIETVAAGGGSICRAAGEQLKVGPDSAGADPGPACYGMGGPLTLTDVNLLLGRLDAERFGIPIDPREAEHAADAILECLPPNRGRRREAFLEGFLRIADERMADAVRRISVRRGYDPRDHALVAFGGAGGQHACALAELLDMKTVILPPDAGLLSALGLGAAVVERFAQRQILRPLAELDNTGSPLGALMAELAEEASAEVVAEGVDEANVEVRRRIAYLRLAGQEATLEIELGAATEGLEAAFRERYEKLYGYRPAARPIEVESLRVVASERARAPLEAAAPDRERAVAASQHRRVYLGGEWREVGVFARRELEPGDHFEGPAFVFDEHSSLVLGPGWRARVGPRRAVIAEREPIGQPTRG